MQKKEKIIHQKFAISLIHIKLSLDLSKKEKSFFFLLKQKAQNEFYK